jgi:hypothetical protein
MRWALSFGMAHAFPESNLPCRQRHKQRRPRIVGHPDGEGWCIAAPVPGTVSAFVYLGRHSSRRFLENHLGRIAPK